MVLLGKREVDCIVAHILTQFPQIFAIFASIGLLMAMFLLPETKFTRPAFAIDGQLTQVDAYGNITVLSDDKALADAHGLQTPPDFLVDNRSASYWSMLGMFQCTERHWYVIIARCYVNMAKAMLDPAVVYCLGASAAVLGTNIGISLVYSTILTADYGWSAESTGLMYLGSLPAGLFAFVVAGWGGDTINLLLARRNGGLHLPEHRVSLPHS